jgi:hypothetical protein
MDVWFWEGRNQRREAKCKLRGSASEECEPSGAPGHPCFPLTEDLHGCRSRAAGIHGGFSAGQSVGQKPQGKQTTAILIC